MPDPVWAELEGDGPDLGPAPLNPGPTAERMWRFEWHDPGVPLQSGECDVCGGRHVPNRPALDTILRAIQRDGAEIAPCACECCVIGPG